MEPGQGGLMRIPEDPPTLLRLLTPQLDATSVLPLLGVLALAGYLLGVRRLRRRGVRWPWHRTVAFCLGIVTLLLVTATQVMGYAMVLFSVHMFQKLVLTLVSAMLLMLGAPVTLLLRTLPRRGRAAVVRRLLIRLLRSRVARVLAHPVTSTVLFVGSLYGFYFTPLFDAMMGNWVSSLAMLMFFLFTGLLVFGGALAVDPWPHRASAPARLIEMAAPAPLHSFFAVAVMMASTPLVTTFAEPPQSWGIDVMTDQLAAGNLAWGLGEVPSILAFAVVFFQWLRSEERRTPAADRRAEADLAAYNAYLARLADNAGR